MTQGNQKYKGIIDCFVRVIKEEGFLSLYRGNGINLVWYGMNQGLLFTLNKTFQKLTGVKKE